MQRRFPQGYTLDDLNNDVYGNQGAKWEKIYNEFKKSEDKGGSINDLKELVIPQVWKLVEPDFQAFITDHPEIANAVPTDVNKDNADAAVQEGENTEEASAEPIHDARHRQMQSKQSYNFSCPANLPLWLGILGSLLGLCSLLIALSNRGKIKEMNRTFARELDRTNANLQEFSTDAAEQMKALSIRLTGRVPRKPVEAEPVAAAVPEEEITEEPAPVDDEEIVAPVQQQAQDVDEEDGETVNLNVAQYIDYDLSSDGLAFSEELYNQILREAVEHSADEGFKAERYFMQHPNPEISQLAAKLGIAKHQLSRSFDKKMSESDLQQHINHLILDFRMDIVSQQLDDLNRQIKEAGSDMVRVEELMTAFQKAQDLRNALARQLGSDIMV
jgi:hypothetical protein